MEKYRPTKVERFFAVFWTTLTLWLIAVATIVMAGASAGASFPKSWFGWLFLGIGALVYAFPAIKDSLNEKSDKDR